MEWHDTNIKTDGKSLVKLAGFTKISIKIWIRWEQYRDVDYTKSSSVPSSALCR
jgi:hypothetical protein